MFNFYRKYRKYFSILFILLLLCSFYQLGLSWPQLIALGLIFITFILLREPIKQKSDKLINEKLPFLNKLPVWLKRVIVLLVFFLVYAVLKQAIFFGFKAAGVDFQEMIQNAIENPQEETSVTAVFLCNDNKTIKVTFYKGESVLVNPGEMPVPTGSVDIILSDGRDFNLKQTISASGVRYANEDESLVFWNKGNGALVLENNQEKSYIGCVVLAPDPGGLPNVYSDGTVGFSIRYPEGYKINTDYKYQYLGPGKDIYGVRFTIPEALAVGTNLSSHDTGVSVEVIPAVQDCNANLFLDQAENVQRIADSTNVEYSVGSMTQGAAGNHYEERVWALIDTNPCVAVRYFIHSTNIDNYEPGTVEQFDPRTFLEVFDQIRQSLTII